MKNSSEQRRDARSRRRIRIRKKIRGTADRPRLVVFRSLRHVEGQVVDDEKGITLVGLSTQASDVSRDDAAENLAGKVADAFAAGRKLGEKAVAAGVDAVVFDRGGYPYHGRVKAFADGARAGGLRF